jgi:hypothetical protein
MIVNALAASGTELKETHESRSGSSNVRVPALCSFVAMLIVFGLAIGRAEAAPAPQDAQAPAQPTPAPRPAVPVVLYKDGQLTIVAENVTLSEIMSALHSAMGTQIDLPAGASSERIWAHLGPASAHKVLSDLLGNTDLNYIIQGSPSVAGAIQSVTLSARAPDGAPGKGSSSASPIENALARRGGRVGPDTVPEPEPAAAPEAAPAPQEAAAAAPSAPSSTPAATTPAAAQSADATPPAAVDPPDTVDSHEPTAAGLTPTGAPNVIPQTPQPSAGSFNPHPSPPPSMSTEQVVQQLANMYQQRRQMQQNQNGSPN